MLTTTPTFLVGFDYSIDRPALVLGTPRRSDREAVHMVGTTLTLRRMQRRYCIGRYDLASFETSACPDNVVLDDDAKGGRCDRCEYFCGFNPAFYRTDVMSPQQRAYSDHPHAVYVACFGQAALKVGISHERRLRTRLLEQGARAALILGLYPDARSARAIEEQVSLTGLREHLSSSAKRRLLNERFIVDSAFVELREMRRRLASAIPSIAAQREQDPIDLSLFQGDVASLRLPILDLSDTRPLAISGRGVGLIGDVMVVEQNRAMYMIALKQMVSYTVRIDFEETTNPTAPAQQASLF